MSNISSLKPKGLFTFQNFLSVIPEGALLDATNVVIDRDGIIEPRRGIAAYGEIGTTNDRAKQLLTYKGRVLAHYDDIIAYDNGTGTFTDFVTDFLEVQAGLRIKAIELNGNCYVTTAEGIKKIAAATSNLALATVTDAGGIKALDGQGVVDYSTPGFFTGLSKVAYRLVWGTKDANNNTILGSPSSRVVLTNSADNGGIAFDYSLNSAVVDLTFQVPDSITTDYFYQIYRTAVSTADTLVLLGEVDPGDQMRLVYESPISDGEMTAGEIILNDIVPQDFQQGGAFLYTNPTTGEGILQANEPPPVAKDIAIFKNSAFYANIRTSHTLDISLLGVTTFEYGVISSAVLAVTTLTVTSTAHGMANGDKVVVTIPNSTNSAPVVASFAVDDVYTISGVTANTFDITVPATITIVNTNGAKFFASYVTITSGASNDYFFVGNAEVTSVVFSTQTNTVDGSWFEISAADNLVEYFVWFDKTGTTTSPTVAGKVGIRVDISAVPGATNVAPSVQTAIEEFTNDFTITESPAGTLTITNADTGPSSDAIVGGVSPGVGFSITKLQDGYGEDSSKGFIKLSGFLSSGQAIDTTARSMIRVINETPAEVIYGYYLSSSEDIPGLMHFERRDISDTAFSIIANNVASGGEFNPDLTTASTSADEEFPNRVMFSKNQQPEAVPIVNYIDIGPKDQEILRIVPLRDSLFIFKQDGIYRLTGTDSTNFSVILFDNSVQLIASDSASVLNNQIYCITDGGIATVTETGVGVISRPIENEFIRISTSNFPSFSTATFGFGYETERSYYIWTVTNQSDTYATQAFRYNTFTQAWTRWDKPQQAGVVNPSTNLLYLADPLTNNVEVERKSQTRRDYADGEVDLSIGSSAVLSNTTFIVSSAQEIDLGDAIIQTQYLTVSQYNNLLLKLDADPRIGLMPGTFDTNYAALLTLEDGDSLTNGMISLVAKLNADPGTSSVYVFSGTSNFATIQTEYNTMITTMNLDPILKFINYMPSVGTSDIEMTVVAFNRNASTVTGDSVPSFVVGPITAFKGIATSVVWAPSTFEDPALLKHVREATTMFESSSFRGGIVSYNTDLSPSFESIAFRMDGNGTWGGFNWGENTWGGGGLSTPLRTYIPRQKQRCRYIRSKFEHSDAFYKFSILGISYAFEVSSERAYRGKT